MSLVNIAAHLAQTGRRVLIVDFDLEAPGIRTYQSLGNPAGESNGLVDYIKKVSGDKRCPRSAGVRVQAVTQDRRSG